MARQIGFRILVSFIIGFVFGFMISEGSYLITRQGIDRGPMVVQLVIPAGTAAKIAAGQPEPSIPAEMVFVQGDTLVVKNEDTATHELGPVFVPAGSTGTLVLNDVQNYSYACSFQTSQYFGLDVQSRLDWGIRLQGILSIGLPTSMLLVLYSIVIYPLKQTEVSGNA